MMTRNIILLVSATFCTGCADIIAQELGIETYDQDQCLLRPLKTNDGAVLAAGTRGTFQETDGEAMFIVDVGDGPPNFYSITGQSWSMRSCG